MDNPVSKVMELGNIVGLANHTVVRHRDGTLIPIEDSAAPIRDDTGRLVGVVLVFRDATSERKSQETSAQDREDRRRCAPGRNRRARDQQSAGSGQQSDLPGEDCGPECLTDALCRSGACRAGAETRVARHAADAGLLPRDEQPAQLDLPALVESVLRLYSNKFKTKNIQVYSEFGACPPLQGWPGELQQVVANLISNAADAVETGGTLKVNVSLRRRRRWKDRSGSR